jgi:hypothetical protein
MLNVRLPPKFEGNSSLDALSLMLKEIAACDISFDFLDPKSLFPHV